MPIYLKNKSYALTIGNTSIEKMGGNKVTYSMYGENVPLQAKQYRDMATPLKWIDFYDNTMSNKVGCKICELSSNDYLECTEIWKDRVCGGDLIASYQAENYFSFSIDGLLSNPYQKIRVWCSYKLNDTYATTASNYKQVNINTGFPVTLTFSVYRSKAYINGSLSIPDYDSHKSYIPDISYAPYLFGNLDGSGAVYNARFVEFSVYDSPDKKELKHQFKPYIDGDVLYIGDTVTKQTWDLQGPGLSRLTYQI